MKKKMISVIALVALIVTAVSVNFAYASMYGKAVANSLKLSAGEHTSEAHAAKQKEKAMTDERIMECLKPNFDERSDEIVASKEYAAIAAEEIRLHEREKKVGSIVASGKKGEYQKYAWSRFEDYGWNENDLSALIKLWNKESGWNTNAHNRSSGAHGIPQALPASKMAAYGPDYMNNYKTQIDWGLHYVSSRYGSPSRAWSHFCSRGWY